MLAKVASLSLNSVAKTEIQCSSLLDSSRTDSEGLLKLRQLSGNLPRGSFGYWEFPRSCWSHSQGSLSVSFAIPEYLPLYCIKTRPCLSKISSLLPLILSRSKTKSKTVLKESFVLVSSYYINSLCNNSYPYNLSYSVQSTLTAPLVSLPL